MQVLKSCSSIVLIIIDVDFQAYCMGLSTEWNSWNVKKHVDAMLQGRSICSHTSSRWCTSHMCLYVCWGRISSINPVSLPGVKAYQPQCWRKTEAMDKNQVAVVVGETQTEEFWRAWASIFPCRRAQRWQLWNFQTYSQIRALNRWIKFHTVLIQFLKDVREGICWLEPWQCIWRSLVSSFVQWESRTDDLSGLVSWYLSSVFHHNFLYMWRRLPSAILTCYFLQSPFPNFVACQAVISILYVVWSFYHCR